MEICLIVSSSVQTQIKRCSRDAAAAFRSISAWHCFMWRAAVVCCWQGSVWKVTGRITCVRVHSSVNPCAVPFPAQDESLLTRNYVTRWNKGMRSKQTLGSLEDFHCQNVLSLYVQSTSEAETTSFRTELTVKQTPVEERCAPEPLHGLTSFFCNVYQSVTNSVYMWFHEVFVTSVPRLNQIPPPPPTPNFSSLDTWGKFGHYWKL